MKKEYDIGNKKVILFYDRLEDVPIVYIHTGSDIEEDLWNLCKKLDCPNFILALITNINWNDDLTPWSSKPIFKEEMYTGQADEYLKELIEIIIPGILKNKEIRPSYQAIAGYSLAGLFALYSIYRTNIFSKVASISSSLWYPDFINYARNTNFARVPECIYFSLGNKESKTRNLVLQTVEKNTKELENFYKRNNIKTTFILNEGNHFKDVDLRIAQGIKWILEN